jgi:hypothetical protein
MTFAGVLLACHLTAVAAMLASLGTDWVGMLGLRKAAPADLARARASLRVLEISAAFGVWARLVVLIAGLWLAIDAWSWQGWIIAGLVGWTALVLLGDPLTGKGLRAMAAEAKTADGTIPASLLARIHHPAVVVGTDRTGLPWGTTCCRRLWSATSPPAPMTSAGHLAATVARPGPTACCPA